MYIRLYNIMAINSTQYFMISFAFILLVSLIMTVLLDNELSSYTLGLIGLSITLFSLNICSILGICANNVELIRYSKNSGEVIK